AIIVSVVAYALSRGFAADFARVTVWVFPALTALITIKHLNIRRGRVVGLSILCPTNLLAVFAGTYYTIASIAASLSRAVSTQLVVALSVTCACVASLSLGTGLREPLTTPTIRRDPRMGIMCIIGVLGLIVSTGWAITND